MKVKFSKMHGLGNDFVVINNLDLQYNFTEQQISYIANRKLGIGCDQVLIIDHPTDGISDFYYKIFNSDGNIAGQCGNGARCFIRYVTENNLTTKNKIHLQTRDRIISGVVVDDGSFLVDMGVPDFKPENIPLNLDLLDLYHHNVDGHDVAFSSLSMGNPHAVVLLSDEKELENLSGLASIAVGLQNSTIFPDSVNVNFVYKLDQQTIRMLTYERGCGFTLACGSGACASAAAMIKQNLVDNHVKMIMPGGELTVIWFGGNLQMQGSATHVYNGEIEI